MDRRRFLECATLGTALMAGCSERSNRTRTADSQSTPSRTTTDPIRQSKQLPFDIGAVYHIDIGGDRWERCIRGRPSIGTYDAPPKPAVVERQSDQILTHGIGRLVIPVRHEGDINRVLERSDQVSPRLSVEFAYDPVPALGGNHALKTDLRALEQAIHRISNYSTINGQSVISLVNLSEWRDGIRLHSNLTSAFESPADFLRTVRDALTRSDSTTPYVVGDLVRFGPDYRNEMPSSYLDFAAQFDAVSNQIWKTERTVEWQRAYEMTSDWYLAGRMFADEHDVEFEPVVFPGWNRRSNECWDSDEVIPREPSHLLALLQVAGLFGTTNRLLIESFNDWNRGTQIEPGTLEGDSYGDGYLASVRTFQSSQPNHDLYGRSVYYVGPEGSDGNPGTEDEPLATIQHALFRARPGATVHVLPGEYDEPVETLRSGEPNNPITITGPREAVHKRRLTIFHSHVHLTGLTFDGLHDPENPDEIDSYAQGGVAVNPFDTDPPAPYEFPGYVEDIVVKPHAIGNTEGAMINTFFANDVEIGEFEVIGPGGMVHLLDEREGHNGEIVYIGTPPDKFGGQGTTITGADVDESHGYHVHHIDNSAGHEHAELVDVKAGAYDVTIEYCTDGGGAASYLLPEAKEKGRRTDETAIDLTGNETTLRWCHIEGSRGQAVEVGWGPAAHLEEWAERWGFEPPEEAADWGKNNSVYGNRLMNNEGLAIQIEPMNDDEEYGLTAQDVICGNEYTGETHGSPGTSCPESIPEGDGIGHLGGESPWD